MYHAHPGPCADEEDGMVWILPKYKIRWEGGTVQEFHPHDLHRLIESSTSAL